MKENQWKKKRFCQLCGKNEFKEECSYGPKMWEDVHIKEKNFNKSIIHPANSAYEDVASFKLERRNESTKKVSRAWFGKAQQWHH